MKAGIRSWLLDDSDITDIVGVTGVYSFPAPQGASMPYIMISRVTGTLEYLIDQSLDIYDEPWQIDILTKTDKQAEQIKELVITRMDEAQRTVLGDYFVWTCDLNFVAENSDLEDTAGEKTIHRKTCEFQIKRNRETE